MDEPNLSDVMGSLRANVASYEVPGSPMARMLLQTSLQCAVPLEIDQMRQMNPGFRRIYIESIVTLRTLPDDPDMPPGRRAANLPDDWTGLVTRHGDDLAFGGRQCAPTFAALTRALAALAWLPGGVTFAGMHFCTDRQACKDADAEVAAGLVDEPGAGKTEVA